MIIAIEGCCHGELDKIYASIQETCHQSSSPLPSLLLICGDFQAIRNPMDLSQMAVPPKHRHLGTFYQYYNGEKQALVPTVFIGGNHEASNYLMELYHGGFVAPNIYYLGASGVITVNGLRIGGISGIYHSNDYKKGYYERVPLDEGTMRSVYHVRAFEVSKLLMLASSPSPQHPINHDYGRNNHATNQAYENPNKLDIMISHDWPQGIAHHGSLTTLLQQKPYFRADIQSGDLGSPPNSALLAALQPTFWFAAHLHVKFAAVVNHATNSRNQSSSEEIMASGHSTRFLALDKCLPRRDFLQLLHIAPPQPPQPPSSFSSPSYLPLCYDAQWLAIIKKTRPFMTTNRHAPAVPPSLYVTPSEVDHARKTTAKCLYLLRHGVPLTDIYSSRNYITENHIIDERLYINDPLIIPSQLFCQTMPVYSSTSPFINFTLSLPVNPQSMFLCRVLDIPLPFQYHENSSDTASGILIPQWDTHDGMERKRRREDHYSSSSIYPPSSSLNPIEYTLGSVVIDENEINIHDVEDVAVETQPSHARTSLDCRDSQEINIDDIY